MNRKRVQETDFINCVAFDRQAESAEKYFKKGLKLCVVGHLQIGAYTNKDGIKMQSADVIVDEWEFAESKQNAQNANNGGYEPKPNIYAPRRENARENAPRVFENNSAGDGFADIDGQEGLPFD